MSTPQESAGGWGARLLRESLPTIGNYCLLLVLFVLVSNGWRFLLDSDTGWQIRTGDWILAHGAVPRRDIFSYTMAGHPWFAWEWLSDVLMSLIHRARGLGGIVAASVVLLTMTYGALFRVMVWRGADAFTAFALTLFAAFASMIHWLARPHLLSIPLMIVWCFVVERHRRTGGRGIYALPPLIALWANLHGAFVVTFPMLAVYAGGEWLERARRGEPWSPAARRCLGTYALVGGLSLLASLATPYGVSLLGHLWRFAGERTLLAGNLEFRSPDFHGADGTLVELLLVLGVLAAVRAAREGHFVEVGLTLLWGHLTLQSERHVTLATVVLLPFVAEQASRSVDAAFERASRAGSAWGKACGAARAWAGRMMHADRLAGGGVIHALTLGLLLVAWVSGTSDRWLPTRVSARRFPVGAADFIATARQEGRLRGRLFAHDQYGGYLIYRLYPDVQVFVDGRGDLFVQGPVLDEMTAVTGVEPTWSRVLDRRGVEWILTPRESPLAVVARASGAWKPVYGDSTAQVLVRAARAVPRATGPG